MQLDTSHIKPFDLQRANEDLGVNRAAIEKIDIIAGKAFLLKNVLSPEECQCYIQQSEQAGYTELNVRHRTNERVMLSSEELSAVCFQRIKPFIPESLALASENSDDLWSGGSNDLLKAANEFDS
uniref:Uncharacterized protein n=1 Tax=Vannella robusta TaxID=1487602 RepID=A0A7S4HZ99_9EUKA|mmetsp:Transcript_18041/g.22888  ORF Transcript_18041/g.22888 Transcript_18041/m.22888 type:complete len:125 (+) Transcript_18041:39-413(+)